MIKEVYPEERPRERCLVQGPESLSLRECLAVLLGSGPKGVGCLGLADLILDYCSPGMRGSDQERAFFMAFEKQDLFGEKIKGIGHAKKALILSAVEIGRRYSLHRASLFQRLSIPLAISELRHQALSRIDERLRIASFEWLGFVPIYRGGLVGGFCLVEKGVRNHVMTDEGEIFGRILRLRPSSFFLFHNHPSGCLAPSLEDIDLTQGVDSLAQRFGMVLLGHGIVTYGGEQWICKNDESKGR